MARPAVVSPRARVSAALWVVVVSLVAYTVWVILERDVRGSCSTSALVLVFSWFGFPLSLSSPFPFPSTSSSCSTSSAFSSGDVSRFVGSLRVVRHLTFLLVAFPGSVPSLLSQTFLRLVRSTTYGPPLLRCGGSFCSPTPTRLHSSLAELAAPHLPSISGSYLPYFILLLALSVVSFKFWLYRVVVPSFHNVPMDKHERWPIHDLHRKLDVLHAKCSTLFSSLWQHSLRPSLLHSCSLHHILFPLLPITAILPSVVVDHQLCFKPDVGITYCSAYSIPTFNRLAHPLLKFLLAVWHSPLVWRAIWGLVLAVVVGYLVYWYSLIYLVMVCARFTAT